MSKLVEVRNKLDAKRDELASVFEAAGEDLDFSNKEVLEKLGASDSADAVEKVRARNAEIEELYDEAKELAELDGIRADLDGIGADLNAPSGAPHPSGNGNGNGNGRRQRAQIGDLVVQSEAYKHFRETGQPSTSEATDFSIRDIKATLFETGAGWPPESVRSGRLIDAVTRPIQVLDIIPMGSTDQAAYVYMEETTRTHAAAETAEGAAFKEAAFALTERSSTVRKITTSIPVTDEQLEDVAGIQSYLNNRLSFGIRQRFDNQVLNGNGTPPNLEGILNVSGIQTQAKGTDPRPDAVHKAMTKVRVTGRAFPNFHVMHPNDWEEFRLLRTNDGVYIWGNPSQAGPERIWGLPVVQADSIAEGTALVGDFNFCQAFERRGIDIQVGFVGSQFTEGKRTIRADMRLAFVVFRPAAFSTVTGI